MRYYIDRYTYADKEIHIEYCGTKRFSLHYIDMDCQVIQQADGDDIQELVRNYIDGNRSNGILDDIAQIYDPDCYSSVDANELERYIDQRIEDDPDRFLDDLVTPHHIVVDWSMGYKKAKRLLTECVDAGIIHTTDDGRVSIYRIDLDVDTYGQTEGWFAEDVDDIADELMEDIAGQQILIDALKDKGIIFNDDYDKDYE